MKIDVLTFETCLTINSEIIKQVTSSWSIFIQLCYRDLVQKFHFPVINLLLSCDMLCFYGA